MPPSPTIGGPFSGAGGNGGGTGAPRSRSTSSRAPRPAGVGNLADCRLPRRLGPVPQPLRWSRTRPAPVSECSGGSGGTGAPVKRRRNTFRVIDPAARRTPIVRRQHGDGPPCGGGPFPQATRHPRAASADVLRERELGGDARCLKGLSPRDSPSLPEKVMSRLSATGTKDVPGRGLTAITLRPGRAAETRRFAFLSVVVDDAALHAACDDDDLAGDVAGELVGGEDDDLARHVVGLGDLAERHRARDAPDASGSTRPRVIGDSVQPGATALTRRARRDAHDLVLQRRSSPV